MARYIITDADGDAMTEPTNNLGKLFVARGEKGHVISKLVKRDGVAVTKTQYKWVESQLCWRPVTKKVGLRK